jgi:hypothetical protein
MWIPKPIRDAKDQGPWILLVLAFTIAFGISAFVENISKLKTLLDRAVLSGVAPHCSQKQGLAYWLFIVLLGLALVCIFLAALYLSSEWRRRQAVQNFDERKTKAYRTLQGMMRAAYRIRTQTYPAIQQPERNKTFDRILLRYEIDQEFNATVSRRYAVRAVTQPLHFWQQSFRVRDAADPAEYLVDLDFKVKMTAGPGEVVYLPTENDERSKAVSLYFLPRIEPGEPAREVDICYRWRGMCKSLAELGEEPFNFNYDSLEEVAEVVLEIYLEPGTGGVLSAEIAGLPYPSAAIAPIAHAQTGWPGIRYSVLNAPAGARVSHSVLAKWRKA